MVFDLTDGVGTILRGHHHQHPTVRIAPVYFVKMTPVHRPFENGSASRTSWARDTDWVLSSKQGDRAVKRTITRPVDSKNAKTPTKDPFPSPVNLVNTVPQKPPIWTYQAVSLLVETVFGYILGRFLRGASHCPVRFGRKNRLRASARKGRLDLALLVLGIHGQCDGSAP